METFSSLTFTFFSTKTEKVTDSDLLCERPQTRPLRSPTAKDVKLILWEQTEGFFTLCLDTSFSTAVFSTSPYGEDHSDCLTSQDCPWTANNSVNNNGFQHEKIWWIITFSVGFIIIGLSYKVSKNTLQFSAGLQSFWKGSFWSTPQAFTILKVRWGQLTLVF